MTEESSGRGEGGEEVEFRDSSAQGSDQQAGQEVTVNPQEQTWAMPRTVIRGRGQRGRMSTVCPHLSWVFAPFKVPAKTLRC